jgi:hypothetical protein
VPNAPIFCGIGKKNTGRRLSPKTINQIYDYYKNVIFPRVLQDPTVPPEDKRKIQELRKKRWNPYVRRHLAATEISKTLKDSVLIDQYLGWSHTGNTRQKYQHYYQDDALDAILQADGLIPTTTTTKQRKDLLKPKICPNCDESNTPDTKFCVKCKYVLSYDAYNEVTEEAEQTKRELAELKAKQEEAARKQQMDMERITAALEKTQDHLQLITAWNEEEQRVTSERLFLKASSAIAARATKKKKEAAADITTKRAKIE